MSTRAEPEVECCAGDTTTTTITHPDGTVVSVVSAHAAAAAVEETQLRFTVNGKEHVLEAHEVHPDMKLLDYLREKSFGLTGTKASCTQGGCGACNVMLSSVNPATGETEHKSVNACLRPLLSMAGQRVTTTEGIGGRGKFHPVQQRIADCNALGARIHVMRPSQHSTPQPATPRASLSRNSTP